MREWSQLGIGGPLLFVAYFVIYGLEYFFPLVRRKSTHLRTNLFMTGLLLLINFVFTSVTFTVVHWTETRAIGFFNHVNLPFAVEIILGIILMDFWSGYIAHIIFHKSNFLWQLHVIHHSDDHVDVTTTFRQHPVESMIRIFFNLSALILLGTPPWVFLFYLTLSTGLAQLEHANLRLPQKIDRILQYVFVTPNMHKVHHSKHQHETDSNYSNIFSIWDRLFNTYTKRKHYDTIEYGLDVLPQRKHYSFWHLVMYPFDIKKEKQA